MKNAHATPCADADSDHNLVVIKVKLKLTLLKKPTLRKRWNLAALKGETKEKLNDAVRSKLQNTRGQMSTNSETC